MAFGTSREHTISWVLHGQTWSVLDNMSLPKSFIHMHCPERNNPFPCPGQPSLPIFYSSSAHQIYNTRIFQWDYLQSCVGFCLQSLAIPTRTEAQVVRERSVGIPAFRAEVEPETRLRAWDLTAQGAGAGSKGGKKQRQTLGWSTEEKLSIECTSSM